MRSMRAAVVALVATLAVAGCGGSATSERAPERQRLADLHSVFPLRAAFNEGRGSPRLVLVLSPT